MTALATEMHKDEAGRITVFAPAGDAAHSDTAPAQSGLAFLGSFYGGHRHLLRLRVRLQRAARLRIEIHGFASRMNKLVAEIAADGTVLNCGEEIEAIEVSATGEELVVMLRFITARSLVEWIYLLAQDVGAGAQALFSCGDISLQALPESGPLYHKRHFAAKRYKGIDVICQSFTVLRSGFNLTFEILKPGSRLVGLGLSSELELAHARWWSIEADAIVPLAGELKAVLPRFPIRSPALMDRYGPHCANLGHTISGIFADWQDIDRLDGPASDRLVALVLHARFSCGEIVDLPLAEITGGNDDEDHVAKLFRKYLEHYPREGLVKRRFLEVGARGPASRIMRAEVEAEWDYIGLDYKGDGNVDIIGDAHRLSEVLEPGSIDLVYSAQVMEHLMSPLRFVLEANRVMKADGLFIASMPTTWPLHAEPWDFWRISSHGWSALLNANTGFEILERCDIGAASVVPHMAPAGSGQLLMAGAPAPLLTLVVARKIKEVGQDTSGWSADLAWGSYDHA